MILVAGDLYSIMLVSQQGAPRLLQHSLIVIVGNWKGNLAAYRRTRNLRWLTFFFFLIEFLYVAQSYNHQLSNNLIQSQETQLALHDLVYPLCALALKTLPLKHCPLSTSLQHMSLWETIQTLAEGKGLLVVNCLKFKNRTKQNKPFQVQE